MFILLNSNYLNWRFFYSTVQSHPRHSGMRRPERAVSIMDAWNCLLLASRITKTINLRVFRNKQRLRSPTLFTERSIVFLRDSVCPTLKLHAPCLLIERQHRISKYCTKWWDCVDTYCRCSPYRYSAPQIPVQRTSSPRRTQIHESLACGCLEGWLHPFLLCSHIVNFFYHP